MPIVLNSHNGLIRLLNNRLREQLNWQPKRADLSTIIQDAWGWEQKQNRKKND